MPITGRTRELDPERPANGAVQCQGLSRRFETARPQITAIEISQTLFSAVDACLDLATRLLDQSASVLMWASGPDELVPEAQALEVVSYLLDARAHVDDRDDRGRTALMIAAEGGHAQIADHLHTIICIRT